MVRAQWAVDVVQKHNLLLVIQNSLPTNYLYYYNGIYVNNTIEISVRLGAMS